MSVPVIKWRFYMPSRFDAFALGWFIIIRPSYMHDDALIAHEMQHIKDQKRIGFFKFTYRYITDKEFRRWAEIRAYTVQGWPIEKIEVVLKVNYNC